MTARYAPGDEVRVRRAFPPGHVRTPFYVRGKTGRVVAMVGRFGDPEQLAYGRRGAAPVPLYRIRFDQRDIWDAAEAASDELVVDLFEHWLEPLDG